ncbi:hypothetical protein BP5796_12865 [Coleophoma crateriformis]|uniref:Amidase domain-containing protein n=1 Tax=Coleophoma crateriformis TaxID=565419 RepID=A0A3D8Q578_9HELO|nr:hypothetical protein BP5796_12865 [Coleophoma crateriformis]
MEAVNSASDENKHSINLSKIHAVTSSLGLDIAPSELEDWQCLLASNQYSIDVVDNLPDYVPLVDLDQFPQKLVHLPPPHENEGHAWAWKVTIDGARDGPLKGMKLALKKILLSRTFQYYLGQMCFPISCQMLTLLFLQDFYEQEQLLPASRSREQPLVCVFLLCNDRASWKIRMPIDTIERLIQRLVGARIVDSAIGGAQGGSIRFTASNCGAVGKKPTRGLVPWMGMATHEPVHDTTGSMTLDVITNAKVLQVFHSRDVIDDCGNGVPSVSGLPDYSAGLNEGVKVWKFLLSKKALNLRLWIRE